MPKIWPLLIVPTAFALTIACAYEIHREGVIKYPQWVEDSQPNSHYTITYSIDPSRAAEMVNSMTPLRDKVIDLRGMQYEYIRETNLAAKRTLGNQIIQFIVGADTKDLPVDLQEFITQVTADMRRK